MSNKEIKLKIIAAGHKAVEELIKVAEEKIINYNYDEGSPDLAADKLKNAAATKKLAIFDAFEILNRIESERENLDYISNGVDKSIQSTQGFAERRSNK